MIDVHNMKIRMLELDVPNKNNRMYPTSVIQKALAEFIEKNPTGDTMPLFREPSINLTIKESVGVVENVKIEDGFLVGDLTMMTEQMAKEIGESRICIRPIGVGSVSNGIVQDDYKILATTIVKEKQYKKRII